MRTRWKAADIPDMSFVDAIAEACRIRNQVWANRWDVHAILDGHPEWVGTMTTFDRQVTIPEKVVLAKARRLINRRVIDGCACGCRGDFEIRVEEQ